MTVSTAQIGKGLRATKDCMDNPLKGASVRGVNMEGPYISLSRRGAQKKEFGRRPD